jgi:hypothetical protein
MQSAMHQFIFTLGFKFEAIQTNYHIGNLPHEWKTTHWPTLLVLCRDYYNSVNPKGVISSDKDSSPDSYSARMNQQKKVWEWFFKPMKFCKEIERDQRKFPDKCIYHLSKSHPTDSGHVKLECEKLVQSNKPSSTSAASLPSGKLHHVTEEVFKDAVLDVTEFESTELPAQSNDTNEDNLQYFALVTNHYLQLDNASLSSNGASRHECLYPVIADSGANFHMFKEKEFFSSILPATGNVLLGDGKTSLTIKGIGMVHCRVDEHQLMIPNVQYIPDLGESIYSLFQHIKSPGHGLNSSFERGLSIIFPSFETKAVIGHHDIYLDAVPSLDIVSQVHCHPDPSVSPIDLESSLSYCRAVTQLQDVSICTYSERL